MCIRDRVNPWELPLLNTLILLLSGTTVTWAHHALQEGNRKSTAIGLAITVALGACFTAIQVHEYGNILAEKLFGFGGGAGGLYGSAFFMATAVSYTHLDVYKRQMAACGVMNIITLLL